MSNTPQRPPCVVMSIGAVNQADCEALKKLAAAGWEIVVTQDADFEKVARIIETVRAETLSQFQQTELASERAASCGMARAAIDQCQRNFGKPCDVLPGACVLWKSANCWLRKWLAAHNQPDAWEVV